MLETSQIKLRAIEEKDLALIASWRSEPKVYEFFYEYQPISLRQQQIWFEKQLTNSSEINFVIADRDGLAIGTVSIYNIDRRNRKAEWGRLIIGDTNIRGTGIGAEVEALILEYVFEHLNLHKLHCEVLMENEKVISLHKKFGFTSEGILKEHVFKAGQYVDVMLLSMLAEQYFNERANGTLGAILNKIQRKVNALKD